MNQELLRARILVVDDDPTIFPLLAAVLEDDPVELCGARSGPEALELLDGGLAPDLLILDLMMPGMGGLEILHQLRGRAGFDQVPVVLLTARSRSEDLVAGLAAGATDYVTKPFELAELKARVRAAIRLRSVFLELEMAREAALQQERLKVLVETTGAVAHAVTQPLTAALLRMEALLEGERNLGEHRSELQFIHRSMEKVADAVRRIRSLTAYRTAPYVDGVEIVELEGDP